MLCSQPTDSMPRPASIPGVQFFLAVKPFLYLYATGAVVLEGIWMTTGNALALDPLSLRLTFGGADHATNLGALVLVICVLVGDVAWKSLDSLAARPRSTAPATHHPADAPDAAEIPSLSTQQS